MPMLLLLVFGVIEFGFMINRDMVVGNASRDGARVASLNASYADVRNTVTTELASAGMPVSGADAAEIDICVKAAVAGTCTGMNAVTYDAALSAGGTAWSGSATSTRS